MKLDLDISPSEQTLLQQQAAAQGKDVAHFILDAVRDKITTAAEEAEPELPPDQWRARLETFTKRHKPTGHPLDDSRESIYPDRT